MPTKGAITDERLPLEATTAAEKSPQTTLPVDIAPLKQQAATSRFPRISESTKLRIKLCFSLVVLASLFLFGKIDLSSSWQAALNADRWCILGAVGLFLFSVVLNAYRWKLLARAVGFNKPLLKLVQYCYVGQFFNLFLPSTVGGDFSRCYYLSKGTGNYASAFYSVLADRALGIAVLFLMASAGIIFGPGGGGIPWQLKAPIFAGAFFVFAVLPFVPALSRRILGPQNWVSRQFNDSPANVYWRNKQLMLVCLSWSIALQILMVGIHVLVGMALGLNQVPFWYYFVFYPSVAVLGFITPSFNGIGIREWAYTYFLTMMGVDRAHALTYAIILLGLTTFMSLVGGLVYMLGHFKISKAEMQELQHQSL